MGVEPVKDQHLDQMTVLVNEVVSQDDEIATTLHNLLINKKVITIFIPCLKDINLFVTKLRW